MSLFYKIFRILKIRIYNKKYFLCLFSSFLVTFTFILIGTQSNQAIKNDIANLVSSAAGNTESGYVNLCLTSTSAKSRSDYSSVFNISSALRELNFNRTGYSSFSGYSQMSQLFSDSYRYSIYGQETSILCSSFNSINLYKGEYTHEIWGGDFMFPPQGFHINDEDSNFCYIPKILADSILDQTSSFADYSSLIGASITVEFVDKKNLANSQMLSWTILNIFDYNEKSECLLSQFGFYICSYINLPNFDFPSIYVQFGHSLYTNVLYLDWFKQNIDFSKFIFEINDNYMGDFNLSYFSKEFFNNYDNGLTNSLYIAILFCILTIAIVSETILFFTKFYFKAWPFVCFEFVGLCIGLTLIYLSPFLGFGLPQFSLYVSILHFVMSIIVISLIQKFDFLKKKGVKIFAITKFTI